LNSTEEKTTTDTHPPVYEARTSPAGKILVARLSRNHAQRAQRLLVKLARVFPHSYNRPDHAPHLFLAKPQHFAYHARILLHRPRPRINFLNKLSYTKRFLVSNVPSRFLSARISAHSTHLHHSFIVLA
jgi:hypothetical protein